MMEAQEWETGDALPGASHTSLVFSGLSSILADIRWPTVVTQCSSALTDDNTMLTEIAMNAQMVFISKCVQLDVEL